MNNLKNVGIKCLHPIKWRIAERVYECHYCKQIIDENLPRKAMDPWESDN